MTTETLNAVIGLSSLIIAVLVPFISVVVAQRLVRWDVRINRLGDILVRIRRDAQNFRNAFLARHPEAWDDNSVEVKMNRTRELLDAAVVLDEDCFLLGLICDKKGNEVGRRVQVLADFSHILFGKPCLDGKVYKLKPFDNCQKRLNEQIMDICAHMEPLMVQMQSTPVFPVLGWIWKRRVVPVAELSRSE